jgi:ABC-type uncharacterized transport system ATPase subunit
MTPNDGTHGPAGVQDVLRTEQISMSFGPVVALRSVDLHLPRGEILGLVGDNGAGQVYAGQDLDGPLQAGRWSHLSQRRGG